MDEYLIAPNASRYASLTCGYLRLLASPFDQGFIGVVGALNNWGLVSKLFQFG